MPHVSSLLEVSLDGSNREAERLGNDGEAIGTDQQTRHDLTTRTNLLKETINELTISMLVVNALPSGTAHGIRNELEANEE